MVNPEFQRFFNNSFAPSQSNQEVTVKPITPADGVSEEAKAMINAFAGPGPQIPLEVPEVRASIRQLMKTVWTAVEEYIDVDVAMRQEDIAGVRCHIFTPANLKDSHQKLIYLHGGAYWVGASDANTSIPLQLAEKAGLEIISVDYRMAPEDPHPAAQDDTVAVYREILDSGIKADDISFIGDSAGGGLALTAALEFKDQGLPQPAAIALISPWTDLSFSGDSHKTLDFYADPRLSVSGLTKAAGMYAGELDVAHPRISPIFADLSGLPPLLIHVGSREIFLSDATRLAKQARKAGVNVTLDVYEAMWHVWHFYPHIPEAEQALDEIAEFVQQQMSN